jgi:hypothetical protein
MTIRFELVKHEPGNWELKHASNGAILAGGATPAEAVLNGIAACQAAYWSYSRSEKPKPIS